MKSENTSFSQLRDEKATGSRVLENERGLMLTSAEREKRERKI
jgi:hypothetical protein